MSFTQNREEAELVAAPYPGKYPDGAPYVTSAKSAAFFDEMGLLGFNYILSPEDTGKSETIHKGNRAPLNGMTVI